MIKYAQGEYTPSKTKHKIEDHSGVNQFYLARGNLGNLILTTDGSITKRFLSVQGRK